MTDNPFRRKMEQKNKTQLLRVINNKHQFRPQAVEAAQEVLQQRKEEEKQHSNSVSPNGAAVAEPASQQETQINPRYSLRAIATYQLISALLIMPSLFHLYPEAIGSAENMAILAFFTLLYLAGFISAILIYQKKYYGLLAALVFNGLQSFYLYTSTLTYFSTGIFSLLYIFPLSFEINFGSQFVMNFSQTEGWGIGFNIVACVAFSLLLSAEEAFRETQTFPEHLY